MRTIRLRLVMPGTEQCFRTFRKDLELGGVSAEIDVSNVVIEERIDNDLENSVKSLTLSGLRTSVDFDRVEVSLRITAKNEDCSAFAIFQENVPRRLSPQKGDYKEATEFIIYEGEGLPSEINCEFTSKLLKASSASAKGAAHQMLGSFIVSSGSIEKLDWKIQVPKGLEIIGAFPRNDSTSTEKWEFQYAHLGPSETLSATVLIG
jgi:hypothetical protein